MKNQEIKVGKSVEVENRIFYPILKIFHWKHRETETFSVSPLALVVVEGEQKYIYPLEEIDNSEELQSLMDMV
ncbi:MAG: hypothetical protein Q4P17_02320 [Methanobacterium sp.]|nr:hypothetical protein [Methanobacterium sp.]